MSRKKKKSAFACRCEYLALRVACACVNILPYALACALARGLAVFAFDVLRINRARTLARIQGVFPGIGRAEARRIAVFSLANIFQNAVEMIRSPRLDKRWITRHVEDIAREFGFDTPLLIISQPTRGVDVGAIEFIHTQIMKKRNEGAAILLSSADLDEVFRLSDRVIILYEGEITGAFRAGEIDKTEIGLYMTGSRRQGGTEA